jgi:phosphomevalonate decarboxylase
MKATATAHPIQGLVKYHGMRDIEQRLPYHDSISVCTAPSQTTTTVAFEPDATTDTYIIDDEMVTGRGAERIDQVVEYVRSLSGRDAAVRIESTNSFPSNIGFGSSSSGFAAAAMALAEAAGIELTRPEISTIARRGSSSAARAVTGGFSQLYSGMDDTDCRSERIETNIETDLRVIAAHVPAYKETEEAHREAEKSHMFEARLAHIHKQIDTMRANLRADKFDAVFELAEHDSLSLAATTMTGPAGWVYWQPKTIEIFNRVRELRAKADIPVYFSTDTGASVYINTTADHAEHVEREIAALDIQTDLWKVGGPARILDSRESLF